MNGKPVNIPQSVTNELRLATMKAVSVNPIQRNALWVFMSREMGFRIFELCLQQLRNNWQTALRISWFWWLVILIAGSIFGALAAIRNQYGTTLFVVFFLIIGLVVLVGGTTIAIGWHKFVLREESFGKLLVYQNDWPVASYVGALLRLFAILCMVLIPAIIVFVLIPGLKETVPNFVFHTAVNFVCTWCFLRVGLVFPAMAVGEKLGFRGSFQLTRPVAKDLLITAGLLVALQSLPDILNVMVAGVGGLTLQILVLPIILFISWVSLFLSVGILTVLYGHLYENRPV